MTPSLRTACSVEGSLSTSVGVSLFSGVFLLGEVLARCWLVLSTSGCV